MRTITKWFATLVSVAGIAACAPEDNHSNPIPETKVEDVQTKSVKNVKIEPKDVIDILKSYPISKIKSGMVDSRNFVYQKLPPFPLEQWLGSTTRDAPIEWKGDECATYDSIVDDNEKHCTSFLVTVRTPLWHCPEIYLRFSVELDGTVYFLSGGAYDFGAKGGMEQIADLEKTLAEVKEKTAPNRPSSLPADSIKAMSDNDMIMHVRALDVHRLDPALPPERFDKWLERNAQWPLQWWQSSELEDYHARCEPKRLRIRVYPAYMVDPKNRRPPADIYVDVGSWEHGIEDAPKLSIYFKSPDDKGISSTSVKDLSALQKKFDEWRAAILLRGPEKPVPAKKAVLQNMSKVGYFSRIRSTPSWHCYGYELHLWEHRGGMFGTFYDLDGQCADSRAPTYIVRDVNFDPETGKLEFWTYGKPGYKFSGEMNQDTIVGKFLDMREGEVKLKRSKDDDASIQDSDKNVEVWCKDYAPKVRNIVEKELKELCKSLGVQ